MHGTTACAGEVLAHHDTSSTRRRTRPEDRDTPDFQRLRHDLQQPLTAIRWSLDSIEGSDDLPVHLSTALRDIERQALWMERLLAGLLGTPERVAVVDVGDVLGDCCSTSPGTPYDLTFTAAGDVPVIVDPVALERAARNLIDNAIRAVADGGQIEVSVSTLGSRAVIEVADSGPGFGKLAPRQGHGLIQVRKFVDRFGGDLAWGSSRFGGALVRLSLPRAVGW